MNQADSRHLAEVLEGCGWHAAASAEQSDLIVVNTCAVRQSAEDRATGYLTSLMPLVRPGRTIALMGCMVGPGPDGLAKRFPHVDVFLQPGAFAPLLDVLPWPSNGGAEQDTPATPAQPAVTAFVPVIEGCNRFCTYCIVPYRRGRERSRPVEDIACEAAALADRGIREVTLLGQTVDAYGHDLPDTPDLGDLLSRVHDVPGLWRLRFLTSHPAQMDRKLVESIARLPKVCPHFSLPVQSGDDRILEAMHRGYTVEEYRRVVTMVRQTIPQASLATDVIVGFPGESELQFQNTLRLLEYLRFDVVHVAAYSPRAGTIAARTMADDVPRGEKTRRLRAVEALQEHIASETNARLLGQDVEVLVEGQKRGKWFGRTRSDKLVFFPADGDLTGQLVHVRIERTSPWSLQGAVRDPHPIRFAQGMPSPLPEGEGKPHPLPFAPGKRTE